MATSALGDAGADDDADDDHLRVSDLKTAQSHGDTDSASNLPLTNQPPPSVVTTAPIAKPRTIRSMSSVGRKPIPPARKLLSFPSLVNVRSNQPRRQPINVIIDVNNGLWRNIRIQDMDENRLFNGDRSMGIIGEEQQQSSNANRMSPPSRRTGQCAEKRSESESDPISVLVEDITHCGEAVLKDVDASSSYESDEAIFNLDQNIMRMGPEWVVPQEYSSSPIVQELAESCEERPKPPLISQYASSLAVTRSVARISHQEKKVSILEQIVRSHPIWYLQHIGRPTATHLLRQMEPGNFIVRASSKQGCMAISVRLPDKHNMKTEHYIVQYGATGNAIRLENSPYSFRSLPLLIEHYCSHSEELQVRLRLPAAVMLCRTTKELQSVALLGQGDTEITRRNVIPIRAMKTSRFFEFLFNHNFFYMSLCSWSLYL
ncbi:hypothetical protein KIN20_009510 [Parelaphostrongylus tenuis]|uniref:SH2 domain-containing protein n=1 Tax=Parelaphostrongylus tenuis TaxID=148309 RepID=A0AAD5QKP5_PARTN|nr:hypothetical protein KIN20_009510 [Parelaphostrongylus tenuis]